MAKTESADGTKKIVIKKYANRRLYNTAKSSYVTLDDLAAMVREGEDFGVYDAKTGEDITRTVLTQIIVEEEGKDQNMLPTGFLRELIRLYGDPLQGVVPGYLDAAMQAFNRNQSEMRKAFGADAAMSNLEQITRANMEFFERSMRMFTPFGAEGAPKPDSEAPQAEDSGARDGDLVSLQEQLKAMQAQLEKLSKGS
ncbi:MAG: polyhydroxyalkanoate synthesis repressor PhaR [Pseudomonadota bacterium]